MTPNVETMHATVAITTRDLELFGAESYAAGIAYGRRLRACGVTGDVDAEQLAEARRERDTALADVVVLKEENARLRAELAKHPAVLDVALVAKDASFAALVQENERILEEIRAKPKVLDETTVLPWTCMHCETTWRAPEEAPRRPPRCPSCESGNVISTFERWYDFAKADLEALGTPHFELRRRPWGRETKCCVTIFLRNDRRAVGDAATPQEALRRALDQAGAATYEQIARSVRGPGAARYDEPWWSYARRELEALGSPSISFSSHVTADGKETEATVSLTVPGGGWGSWGRGKTRVEALANALWRYRLSWGSKRRQDEAAKASDT